MYSIRCFASNDDLYIHFWSRSIEVNYTIHIVASNICSVYVICLYIYFKNTHYHSLSHLFGNYHRFWQYRWRDKMYIVCLSFQMEVLTHRF